MQISAHWLSVRSIFRNVAIKFGSADQCKYFHYEIKLYGVK